MARTLALVLVFLASAARAESPIFADGFDASAACVAGSPVRVAVAVGPAARATYLATTNVFAVDIRSCGYAGNVTLGTIGLPAGWTATFPQTSITLADGEVRATTLTVNVPGNAIAGPEPFAAVATISGVESASADLLLDIANMLIVTEPFGTGDVQHGYNPFVIRVKAGATIRFRNDDNVVHILHGAGIIPHENNALGNPGRIIDVATTTPGTTGYFYCHNHGVAPPPPNVFVE